MPEAQNLIRLDVLLVQMNLFETRTKADDYIKQHGVKVDGKLVNKPGKKFPETVRLELPEKPMPWVSRAALKLLEALEFWSINPENLTCLDVGSSTGGFSQVLLERGASKVYAVDTGTDQLHGKLRGLPNLILFEQTDIRNAQDKIQEKVDLIVVDVSFISLDRILASLLPFAHPKTQFITLFKPQFEVGKEYVGKNGIVKDQERVNLVAQKLIKNAELCGLQHHGTIDSPITGGDGNKEYLMMWSLK